MSDDKDNTKGTGGSAPASGTYYSGNVISSDTTANSTGGGGGGSSYGSSGSSYGSSGSSSGSSGMTYEEYEEKQKQEAKELAERAASNLQGVVGYNAQTILNAAENSANNYKISDEQNAALRSLENRQAQRNAGDSWYNEQQKLQSTVQSLRDQAGNAANGSFMKNFWDAIARADDEADAETLNTLRENINNNDNDYWQAIMTTNNSRNDMYADTEQNLRELASDYIAQLNNLETNDTDLLNGLVDTEGHTINVPDWIQTEYYNEHVQNAIQPDETSLVREANAAQAANSLASISTSNIGQSTNNSYWSRLRNGYSRRSQ